ncbi:MAG: HAD-IC family P-type ATPase [Gammaproteobacteria bacterium]|nr:HAD-IC family P-type ATPase [Gammaproteobacteria bacterium]NIM72578.1 HAD-IC family P-type ATPase [Gammaproteobacteria bacterium]NIN37635.1 HAD-IC family P-type ATPase [Gammaproteobacteria bacterium]NIO24339.1 HAD-IC family P-type ATPase [Gammaproteobacteria bacterium]NIO64942.1 HAD-IC family P-type ATPase [Gammaproteobacteria bacterium]
MTRRALILTGSNALETLARAERFVFDKTGTLTHGRPRVVKALAISDMAPDVCARIAASLERHSEHAIAKALVANARAETSATEVVNTPGGGLQGNVSGTLYTIGTPSFVEARTGHALTGRLAEEHTDDACSLVVLADASAARCLFYLRDELRPDARELVASLRRYGNAVSLYSGDRTDITSRIAAEIGIDDVAAGLSPQEKLARVRELQNRGEVVAMVGDGINDTPVLSGADVSIAMGDGAQAARASADMILIGNDLSNLAEGTAIARRTLSVIRQNLLWAATYNLLAIPAAAAGFVAPWMAAIGMSASSLLVVANSMRLARSRRRTGDDR